MMRALYGQLPKSNGFSCFFSEPWVYNIYLGKGAKKIEEKKLTNVSFMYVCVAGNGEMLAFFSLFPPTIV